MSEYIPRSKTVWLLFDLSNGHRASRRYCWWFETRKAAMEHRQWQLASDGADLSMPVKFKRET